MRTPRPMALAGAVLCLTLAAAAMPCAGATEPFDGEFGLLLGIDRADPDVAGPSGEADLSPLLGLRWASRIATPTNWFLDGIYAQHETALGENSKLYEVRTGLEHLMPIGTGDLSWFLAGAVGGASYDYPAGLEDVSRPLLSAGVGLAQRYSSGILRGELRAEQLLGDNGWGGAAVTNVQLLVGWSFGLRSPPARKPLFEKKKKTLVLEGVNFELDSAELTHESFAVLDEVAASLRDWPKVRVEVGGHTDSIADDAYNQALSERRAETVRNYLISKGVAASRLTAKGYGETRPVASNDTDEGRAKNRRVELTKLD